MAERNLLCSALILSAVCFMVVDGGRQRRSDDINALQTMVERLSQDVSALQSQLAAQNNLIEAQRQRIVALEAADNYTVAFSAYISEPNAPAAAGATVPFRNVITNVGGAYNPSSSAFTAPVAGQYFFMVHADCTPDYRSISINVNGVRVIGADNDGGEDHRVTGGGVVALEVGDVVSTVHWSSVGSLDAGIESIFTGFLVK